MLTGAGWVEVACIILAFACVCFLTEARVEIQDLAGKLARKDERLGQALKRAADLQDLLLEATAKLEQRLPARPRTAFDRHTDQALDVQA